MNDTAVTPEIQALAQKIAAQKAQEIEDRKADIAAKYPHADVSTLQFDSAANKFSVEIKCVKCGAKRRVFTSDLFQVRTCVACSKSMKAEIKVAKGEMLKKALALIATGQLTGSEAAADVAEAEAEASDSKE